MAYALRCADSGMDRPGQFTTKTESEWEAGCRFDFDNPDYR
jgi:hypothetical protein